MRNAEPGLDDMKENEFSWRSTATIVLSAAEIAIDSLPVPGAKACIALVLKVLDASEIADENEQLLKQLQTRCQDLRDFVISVSPNAPETIQKSLQAFDRGLAKLSEKWERRLFRNSRKRDLLGIVMRWFNASRDRDVVEAFITETDQTISSFLARFEIENFIAVQKEIVKNRQLIILSTVKTAQYASYDAARVERLRSCLDGTRKKVLETLNNWALDTDPSHFPIFWLNGLAGIGKTTIAHTLAASWDDKHHLGGSFFFLRSDDQLKDARLVFPTLALQLLKMIPAIRAQLAEVLDSDPSCVTQAPEIQFDRLILKPLTAISLMKPLILVLDALDECQPNNLTEEILRTLLRKAMRIPFLRILITSRPEAHIREALGIPVVGPMHHRLVLHENVEVQQEVAEDIRLYLKTSLQEIWNRERPGGSPRDEDVDMLVRQSGKLFIYAATAVRFIAGSRSLNVDKQLSVLLKVSAHHIPNPDVEPYGRLDSLYLKILEAAFEEVGMADPAFTERFRRIVGSIVLMQKTLPLESLAAFLVHYDIDDIRKTLYNIHSIVVVPEEPSQAVQTYHLLFPNFITDSKRCIYNNAYIDSQELEQHLFLLCLDAMKRHYGPSVKSKSQPTGDHLYHGDSLKTDGQSFEDASQGGHQEGDERKDSDQDDHGDMYEGDSTMTPDVRYAKNHWCSHLVRVQHENALQSRELIHALVSFIGDHFPLWLKERVTLIKQMMHYL